MSLRHPPRFQPELERKHEASFALVLLTLICRLGEFTNRIHFRSITGDTAPRQLHKLGLDLLEIEELDLCCLLNIQTVSRSIQLRVLFFVFLSINKCKQINTLIKTLTPNNHPQKSTFTLPPLPRPITGSKPQPWFPWENQSARSPRGLLLLAGVCRTRRRINQTCSPLQTKVIRRNVMGALMAPRCAWRGAIHRISPCLTLFLMRPLEGGVAKLFSRCWPKHKIWEILPQHRLKLNWVTDINAGLTTCLLCCKGGLVLTS